ncbi:von Willebrand factor type A domain protein [Gimesia panareensis]|uniref:von Willebrand factor type A domain protein n=1 Tax=Gimesia panareensis TaxID=2527978 RepID=A0A518FIE8_9PLAN|nr:glutamine amidotransferase [Gimesia panareensis]QDV16128.1 von Willebrand factor type A domain protein [Gimesia panareensis]
MKIKELYQQLVPRPRTPVTWKRALPLIFFLLLYAGLCAGLEISGVLMFARPWAFVLILFSVWVWWLSVAGYGGLSKGRALATLLTRLGMLGLFVILIAEPRSVRVRDVISVIYAIDRSDSINQDFEDAALAFVTKSVTEKPPQDEAGLVVFGRNSAVELPPRVSFPFEAYNSRIDRDATNLEQTLSLAAAMLPEENRGRIVLISDGTETEGAISQILDELKSRDIAVDVLPMQYEYDKEVWLENLELPRFVKLGENYEAAVVLSSLKDGTGRLVLRENGEPIFKKEVSFKAGKNRFVVPISLRDPGYYEYSATIETKPADDQLRENNTVMNYIYVEGEGKVLVVTDPAGDERDWETLEKAIREGERNVEVVSAYEFPSDSLSLMPYDAILFVNVPADAFNVIQLKAVHDAVFNQGIGFMMVGGDNSFGPGGYHRTVIEDALPVTMDITKKKVLPKGALAIILHTCEFPEGNTWGKRITKQAIKVLGAQDEVGVLAYDYMEGEKWLFKLTPAGEYEKMVPKINGAQIGDMPSFVNTMRLGLEGLKKSDASTKHMIIISDGDPQAPNPALISEFLKNKVSVSMVAIFPHGGRDISKMRDIAGVTGGRYYFPSDPNQLPSIFIKESKTLKRSMIQNETFTPEVGMISPVLKGIDRIPPLFGYVLTTIKPRAEGVLNAPEKKEAEGEIDPVLAFWRYGLGTTAAFTSDLSSNWGKDWVDWDHYQAFVKQLMIKISRVQKQDHLKMWSHVRGNNATIMVEDFHPKESFLNVAARISGPHERKETVVLKQVGPRRYQASVPLWGKGRYQVMVLGKAGGREDHANGGFIVPYSPEYLRFRSNPIVLEEIARRTGGQSLDPDNATDVIYGRRDPKQSSNPIFDWFLIALAILVPLDVGIRRIQIDWYVIKGWFGIGKEQKQSTETMGTLLQRKQVVADDLDARRAETTERSTQSTIAQLQEQRQQRRPGSTTESPGKPETKKKESGPPPPPAPTDKTSTTGRLLDMKRKRNSEDKDNEQK